MSAPPDDTAAVALLDEVTLPSARGGRRPEAPLTIAVKRSLTETDLPRLREPAPVGSGTPTLATLRASHHQLARLLSEGLSETECSLMTGYALSRISVLKRDPAFAELLANYCSMAEVKFADLVERCRVAGISAVDELLHRLETQPGTWSLRELMEFGQMMLDRGGAAAAGAKPMLGTGGVPPVAISVSFVQAQPPAERPVVTIDQEPQK